MSGAAFKVVMERAALESALRPVVQVVSRKNTIPVLSCVLLDASPDGLTLTGSDMERTMRRTVDVPGAGRAAVAVPAHDLLGIAQRLPEGSQVELTAAAAGRLRIACGRSHFHLPALDAADFPACTDAAGEVLEVKAGELRAALDRVSFAVSYEETRYYLNGIFFAPHGAGLRMVATDGHRLARTDLALGGANGRPGIIFPRDSVDVLRKLIDGVEGTVELKYNENRAAARVGDTEFITRLIDGTFPDYERVIPTGNERRAFFGRAELAAALKRLAVVTEASGEAKSRAVKFAFRKDGVEISARRGTDGADGVEWLDVPTNGMDGLEIGFNLPYLLSALDALGGDLVAAEFADAASPTVWRHDAAEPIASAKHLVVVMPMRV